MSGIPVIRRHRLIGLAVAMMTVFAAGIIAVLAVVRTPLAPLDVKLPSYYQPGQTLAPDLPCSYFYYPSYSSFDGGCIQNGIEGLEYTVQFTSPYRRIARASKWTFDMPITLGDLIARWGTPTGHLNSLIVWDDRSASVIDFPDFSPDSKVYFISYGKVPHETDPWTGFVKKKSKSVAIPFPKLTSAMRIHP